MQPFAELWDSWYRGTNAVATNDDTPIGVADVLRTQQRMLDAIVAAHASCPESICPVKQAIRLVLEATP